MWLAFWLLCAAATCFLAMASDFEKDMCKNKATYQVPDHLKSNSFVAPVLKEIADERKALETTQHLQKPATESDSAATLRQNVIFSLTCNDGMLRYCSYVCRTGAGGTATISFVMKVKDRETQSFKCGQANITVKCAATLPNGVEVTSA